ncbi:MAG: SDR family oxidoreductase [Candidatus Omnitrophica bacterium]|nr:SDR family oxidoreductase [Candidatus Omnitrophota bacterium]
MSRRALVTGTSGLLGAHMSAALSGRYQVVGVDRHPAWGNPQMEQRIEELTRPGVLEEMVSQVRPELVVHCAALTDLDRCERQPEEAREVNALLPGRLARALPRESLMVQISTDAVFGGEGPFFREADAPSPRSIYGRTKLDGEREVAERGGRFLIVRTNFYGWGSGRKKTFAEWLVRVLERGEPATLFDDLFFTPIYVVDFCERLLRLIEEGGLGLVHLAGRDRVSKHEFGRYLAQAGGWPLDPIRPGSLSEAAWTAPRSSELSLDSTRFEQLTGQAVPGCSEGIARFLEDRARTVSHRFHPAVGATR